MPLLVISETLGLLLDTLPAKDKYPLAIQMHLPKNQETLSKYFAHFLKFTSNLEHFPTKMKLINYVFVFMKLWAWKYKVR